jgi:hypothetical protein
MARKAFPFIFVNIIIVMIVIGSVVYIMRPGGDITNGPDSAELGSEVYCSIAVKNYHGAGIQINKLSTDCGVERQVCTITTPSILERLSPFPELQESGEVSMRMDNVVRGINIVQKVKISEDTISEGQTKFFNFSNCVPDKESWPVVLKVDQLGGGGNEMFVEVR